MNKPKETYFLLDFDSTFIHSEGLEELAEVALQNHPEKTKRMRQIKILTEQGMNGTMPFEESLRERIKLLECNHQHIKIAAKILSKKISTSIHKNKRFFQDHSDRIYIISGGFKELIIPVVKNFGIPTNQIFANTFTLDKGKNVIGIDEKNHMSQNGGKVKVVQSLKFTADLYMIGDGYTDYEVKKYGLAKKFIAFTENVAREKVTALADEIAPTFDEFLYINGHPRSLSYPKNRITVLSICDLSERTKKQLLQEGYQLHIKPSLTNSELLKYMHTTSILYVNHEEQLTTSLLQHADKLLAIAILGEQRTKKLNPLLIKKGIAVFQDALLTKRIIDYVNTGDSYKSLTLPNINLPIHKSTHRLLHIHHNVPGILAKINHVMGKNRLNIVSQHLQTTNDVGYVITDVDKEYDKNALILLKKIPQTIRFRILY